MDSTSDVLTTLKILIIGHTGVGKSSLLVRFVEGFFDDDQLQQQPTVGVHFLEKTLPVAGELVKLAIWDTAAHERFRTLSPAYYRGSQGILLVFDVSSRESFERIPLWLQEIRAYATNTNLVKMLVGNKIDKDRVVSREDGLEFARRHGMLFIEASAKSSIGVLCAFKELVEKIIEMPGLWESNRQNVVNRITLGQPYENKTGCYYC